MTILECVEALLDISWKLERFKIVKPGRLYNFRCPLCGDSKRSPTKARGYIYENPDKNTLYYKCHNCGASLSFLGFLKRFDEEYYNSLIFTKKYFHSEEEDPPLLLSPSSSTSLPPSPKKRSYNKLDLDLKISSLADLYGTNQLVTLFVNKRKLPEESLSFLYYTENFRDFVLDLNPDYEKEKKLTNDPRIIIPFFDETFNFGYFQGRALLKTDVRYLSITFDKDIPKIYGLYRGINLEQDIYILEGPFDSLFLPNALAVGGSDLKTVASYLPEEKLVFIFDNEPDNPEIVKKMENIVKLGYRICIFPEDVIDLGKDINEMILSGLSPADVLQIVQDNTFSGLKAEVKLKIWKKTLNKYV